MAERTLAVIHCSPHIQWQPRRAAFFAEGFKAAGIPYRITDSRTRLDEGTPVLLGTSCWRSIEATGPYLLVDRCSFGDTEWFVQLVWNGHGRRGDHKVPAVMNGRWTRIGVSVLPWKKGSRVVLCGQVETYSPHWSSVEEWYASVPATHFRPHPAGYSRLETTRDFDNAVAVTLNSSIGVQCVLNGIPTITMDEGSMAWDVTGHSLEDIRKPDRTDWLHWLSYTQYSDDEIRDGAIWKRLWE